MLHETELLQEGWRSTPSSQLLPSSAREAVVSTFETEEIVWLGKITSGSLCRKSVFIDYIPTIQEYRFEAPWCHVKELSVGGSWRFDACFKNFAWECHRLRLLYFIWLGLGTVRLITIWSASKFGINWLWIISRPHENASSKHQRVTWQL